GSGCPATELEGVDHDVAVRQLDALGPAGGPAGVGEMRQGLVDIDLDVRGFSRVTGQELFEVGADGDDVFCRNARADGGDGFGDQAPRDDDPGVAVGQLESEVV